MKKSSFFILFLFFNVNLIAQEADTINISVQYKSLGEHFENPNNYHKLDTSINLFHQYNPVNGFDRFLTNTGNIGSPLLNLIYQPDKKIDFDAGFHHFNPYLFTPEKTNFYNTYTPYANFYYAQGPEEMQVFDATYSQNINPTWNFGMDYNSISSNGFYRNQNSRVRNIVVSSAYSTPNQVYSIYFSAIRNRIEINENGGIPNDSLFRTYNGRSRLGLEMELAGPKQTFHQKSASFFQSLNLNLRQRDTIFPDTILVKIIPEKAKVLYFLEHRFNYDEYYFRYEDDNTYANLDYYKAIYHDSFYTSNRVKFREIENSFFFTLRNNHKNDSVFFLWRSGLKNEIINTSDYRERDFSNNSLQTKLITRLYSFHFEFDGELIFTGENEGNYLLKEKLSRDLWNYNLEIALLQQRKNTPYRYKYFESNLISWQKSFDPQFDNSIRITLTDKKNNTSIYTEYTAISNYLYIDSSLSAKNVSNTISYIRTGIISRHEWKGFHLLNNLVYQTNSDDKIIRLPKVMLNSMLYYQNKLFKNQLGFQLGIEARYRHKSYLPCYYAPFSTFYQNDDYEVPAYATFDVFLNAVVKRARFFFRYEHINQGLFPGNDYYVLPLYPQDPRAFRLGLSWMFFD